MIPYAKMEHSLPSPPLDGQHKPHPTTTKRHSSGAKPTKPAHRVTKRSSTTMSHSHIHSPIPSDSQSTHSMADARHKRVWKACERCRMKKTKVIKRKPAAPVRTRRQCRPTNSNQCDGEFPCKRCKDDGLVCTAGTRKKTEFKQLPRGYATCTPTRTREAHRLTHCFADMPRFWRTLNLPSSPPCTSCTRWSAMANNGILASLT